jgi:hypothetical protein
VQVTDAVDNKTQLISIGADGAVLIWDSTRLTSDGQWGPIVRVNLTNLDGTGELSGSRISIDHASGDSRFYCATEEGDLVFADWQMRESDEERPPALPSARPPACPPRGRPAQSTLGKQF